VNRERSRPETFTRTIHGVRSFEGVRDRAVRLDIGRASILWLPCPTSFAASAPRIGRDGAVLEVLEKSARRNDWIAAAGSTQSQRKAGVTCWT
jgi:hypothetical protein